MVRDESAKTVKIMHLENLALYGNTIYMPWGRENNTTCPGGGKIILHALGGGEILLHALGEGKYHYMPWGEGKYHYMPWERENNTTCPGRGKIS